MYLPNLPSHRRFKKTISLIVAVSFIFSNIALAAIPKTSTIDTKKEAEITTDPEKIVIPRDYGLVKAKYTAKNSGKLVIHIQDAHCNYEAQSNIIKILECLIKNDGLGLISVEGADGFIDTSWFKAFPDADIRKEVADYFMKKGEITGPEFLVITSDYPVKLFGAETRSYYVENLNAFTSSYSLKEDTEKYFNQIKAVLNKLKDNIYSSELKDLDAKSQDYESKKMSFSDYVKYLELLASRHRVALRQYENLFKLISVLIYERKIDFTVVDKERATLIDVITKKLDKDQLRDLVNRSLEFKISKISSSEYYAYLKALASKYGISLVEEYPNLFNYIIYNSVYSRIENEKLFNDIKKFEEAIKDKLFVNDDQRTLDKLSRNINTLLGLVNIRLLNGDFDYYKEHKEEFAHEVFADFIKKMTVKFGFAYEIDSPSEAVIESMPKLEDFYAIAIKRDKALVDNTIQAMKKEDASVSVLVTGGFHSEGITKLLEKQGVSYIVVCPNITKDAETPYIKILTNQRTPLEEILSDTGASSADAKNIKSGMLAPYLITAARINNIKEISRRTKADLEIWAEMNIRPWLPAAIADLVKMDIKPDAATISIRFESDVDKTVEEYISGRKLKKAEADALKAGAGEVKRMSRDVIGKLMSSWEVGAIRANGGAYTAAEHGTRLKDHSVYARNRIKVLDKENSINGAISRLIKTGMLPAALSLKGEPLPGDSEIPLLIPSSGRDAKLLELEEKLQSLGINFIMIKGLKEELKKAQVAQDLVFHYGVTRRSVYIDEVDFNYLFSLPNGVDIIVEGALHEKAHIDNESANLENPEVKLLSEEEIDRIAPSYNIRIAIRLKGVNVQELLKISETKISEHLTTQFDKKSISKELYDEAMKATYKNLETWVTDPDIQRVSPSTRLAILDAVKDAIDTGNWADIVDVFRKDVSFGTAGIREKAALTEEALKKLAQYGPGAAVLKGPNTINDIVLLIKTAGVIQYAKKNGLHKVAIGYDSRIAGKQFAELIAQSFLAHSTSEHKFTVYLFDEASPFPELSFAVTTKAARADLGILISASHNPSNYNGYKITDFTGAQLTGKMRDAIVETIKGVSPKDIQLRPLEEAEDGQLIWLGGKERLHDKDYKDGEYHRQLIDMHTLHAEQVKKFIIDKKVVSQNASKVRIGYSAFNGAGNRAVPRLLRELGFTDTKVITSLQEMNGMFPAFGWGEQPDPGDPISADIAVREFIKEYGQKAFDALDILIGTDPDADRAGIIVKVPQSQQKYFGKYKLLSANDAWTLLLWYRIQRLAELNGGKLPEADKKYIIFSHVTTDALEKVGELFGVRSLGEMRDKKGEDAGGYLNGRRSWVGFSLIAEFCQKAREKGLTNLGGAEESNGFSILGGPAREGEILADDGHVNDKDGAFAALLLAEVAAYAKSTNTTLFELLDKIYLNPKVGYFATANKPMPRVGAFKGAEGVTKKINLLKKAQAWAADANKRSGTKDIFTMAGLSVIGAMEFKTTKYDKDHYEGFPDEGVRFFFADSGLNPGDPFTGSRNYITMRPSGTSQTLRFYTQLFGIGINDQNLGAVKYQTARRAEAISLQAQIELLAAAGYKEDIPSIESQLASSGYDLQTVVPFIKGDTSLPLTVQADAATANVNNIDVDAAKASKVLGVETIVVSGAIAGSVNKVMLLNDFAESVGIKKDKALENMETAGLAVVTDKSKAEYELTKDLFVAKKLKKFEELQIASSSNPAMVDLTSIRIQRIILNAVNPAAFINKLSRPANNIAEVTADVLKKNNTFPTLVASWRLNEVRRLAAKQMPVSLSVADLVNPTAKEFYADNGIEVEFTLPEGAKVNPVQLQALKEYQQVMVNDMARGAYNYRGAGTRQTVEQFFKEYFMKEWYARIRGHVTELFDKRGEPLKAIITNGIGANDQFMWSLVRMYNENKPEGAPTWHHVITARGLAALVGEGKIKPENTLFIDISRSGTTWEGVEVGIRSLKLGFDKRIAIANGGDLSEIAKKAASLGKYAPLVIGMSPDIGGRNMHRKTTIYYTAQTVAGMFLPSMDSTVFAGLNDKFDKANDFTQQDNNIAIGTGEFIHSAMNLLGAEHIAFVTNTEPLGLVGTEWEQYIMEGSNKEDIISMGTHDLAQEPEHVLANFAASPAAEKSIAMVILDMAAESYQRDMQRVNELRKRMPTVVFYINSKETGEEVALKGGISPKQQAAFDILWTDLVTVLTTLLRVDANSNPNVKVVREYTGKRVAAWQEAEESYGKDLIGKGEAETLISYGKKIGSEGRQEALTVANAAQKGRELAASLAKEGALSGRNRLNLFVGRDDLLDLVKELRNDTYNTNLATEFGWITQTGLFPSWSHKGLEANLAYSANPERPLLANRTINIFFNARRIDAGQNPFFNEKFDNMGIMNEKYSGINGATVHQTNDAMTIPNIKRMAEVSPTILLEFNDKTENVEAMLRSFYEAFIDELGKGLATTKAARTEPAPVGSTITFDHTVETIMQSSNAGEHARKTAENLFKAEEVRVSTKKHLIFVKSAIPSEQLATTTAINYANYCADYYNEMEGYTADIVDTYEEAVKLLAKNSNWDKTNTIVGLIDKQALDKMTAELEKNGMQDKTKLLPMETFDKGQFIPLKGFFDLMSVLVHVNRPLDRPEDQELRDTIKDLLNEIGVRDVDDLINALSVAAYFEDPIKFAKNFIIRLLPPTRAASPAELRDRYNAAKKVVESL